jgi:hypothetical protein
LICLWLPVLAVIQSAALTEGRHASQE